MSYSTPMRLWVGLFVLVLLSSLVYGLQDRIRSSTDVTGLTLVGGEYRLERLRIGRTTAVPNGAQKLVTVKYRLPSSASSSDNFNLQVVDGRGRSYTQMRGIPIAAMRSDEDQPKAPRSYSTFERGNGTSILMSTFAVPSDVTIDKIVFGGSPRERNSGVSLDAGRVLGGLDYYVESGVTPQAVISASKGEWYIGQGLDFRFDGWTTKTGTLGEIESAEEGETFAIATFTVRNETTTASELFGNGQEELPFILETTKGERLNRNDTILQPDTDNGLDGFTIQGGTEKQFRVFWKLSRDGRPRAFSVIEKYRGAEGRQIVWAANGQGRTSPLRKSSGRTTEPQTPTNTELESGPLGDRGIKISASQFVKKYPSLAKTIQAAKIPEFNRNIPNIGEMKFAIEADPIVVGPTIEGKIFPKGVFNAKASGTKITVNAEDPTKISATLQILNGSKVVQEKSGKSIELACSKGSTYRLIFGISVGTLPGTYTARFLVNDGLKRIVPVQFLIVAKSGGLAVTPLFSTAPILQAGTDTTLPFNVSLSGNAKSKVTFSLQNGLPGLKMSALPLTLSPGESRKVDLTFSTTETAESHQVLGDEIQVAATAVDLKSQTIIGFKLLIEPIWGIFEYHGKIGNVNYSSSILIKASGDWCWTVAGSTSSTISGDVLMEGFFFNFPGNDQKRYFTQVAFPLGAKLEKMPSSLTYISGGNEPWIRDHFNEIFDQGISAKIVRLDAGLLSFPGGNPFDPESAAPVKYAKWLIANKCAHGLPVNSVKIIK